VGFGLIPHTGRESILYIPHGSGTPAESVGGGRSKGMGSGSSVIGLTGPGTVMKFPFIITGQPFETGVVIWHIGANVICHTPQVWPEGGGSLPDSIVPAGIVPMEPGITVVLTSWTSQRGGGLVLGVEGGTKVVMPGIWVVSPAGGVNPKLVIKLSQSV